MEKNLQNEFELFYKVFGPTIDQGPFDGELTTTLACFVKNARRWSFSYDNTAEAPAQINVNRKEVIFNPLLILESIFELRDSLGLKPKPAYKNFPKFLNVLKHLEFFLLLHEIGHWLYTANPIEAFNNVQQYCKEIPTELCMYLFNVVEDSIIERMFLVEYSSKFYRECFDLGICCLQGYEVIKNYVSNSEATGWSIKNKLFYFILRAYNLYNTDVQSMFNVPDKLGWSDETIKAFDESIIITDKSLRCRYCMETLAPLVYKDLLEELDPSQLSEGDADSSLLDQDKLYKSKDSSQSNGQGQGQGQGQSQDQSQGQGQSQSSDSSETGGQGDSSSASSSSSSSSSSSDSSKDTKSGDTKSEDTKSQDSESSDKDSSDASSGSPSNSASFGTGDEHGLGSQEVSAKDKLDSAIADACEELNNQISASSQPSQDMNPTIKNIDNKHAVSCNVEDRTEVISSKSLAPMGDLTKSIYSNALNTLDKVFTLTNSTLRGLDSGDLDEEELYTFYTEKNLAIYKEESNVVQDRRIVAYFILDISGSMSGRLYDNASAAFSGLIHALEDIQIKCCFLVFSHVTSLVKDFDDPIVLNGLSSNLEYVLASTHATGGTDLLPALDYVASDEPINDTSVYKLVVIATDGYTDNEEECAEATKDLQDDPNTLVFGISLDSDDNPLRTIMPTAQLCSYRTEEIASKLPEDIYEAIIDKFMLV